MDKFDTLGTSGLRETLLLVRAQPAPVTASEVGRLLAVPRTVARSRLERLAAAGLVVVSFERRSGRSGPGAGRPAKTYGPAAETAAIELPRRRYELLVSLLLDALPRRTRAARLRQVGTAFGAELAQAARVRGGATSLRTGLERLCRGLGGLGFHATFDSASTDEAVVVTATCPLRPLVVCDAAARELDTGMWQGLLAAVLDGTQAADLACETEGCLVLGEPCRIRVHRLRQKQLRPSSPAR